MGHPDGEDQRTAAASRTAETATGTPSGSAAETGAAGTGKDGPGDAAADTRETTGVVGVAAPDRAAAGAGTLAQPDDSGADTQVLAPVKRPGLLARSSARATRAARGAGGLARRAGRIGRRRRARGAAAHARPDDGIRPDDVAGQALARLTSLPALLLVAWLIPGLPLLLAGDFVPVPMLLISGPLLVALVANGLRVVPGRWPRLVPGRARDRAWRSWFGLMATVAVAAGFAAWQLVEHSESVIVLRDQGAYLQAGYWLAQHGGLDIPQSLSAFGGSHPGLSFSSIGFFAHGASVVPSFMSGLPILLAGGFWAHGVPGAAALGPVLGGLAVLSFGGLTARLAGPHWAPAGAIVLALTLPEQYVSRTSLAETAVQILLFGGLCLFIDSLTVRSEPLVTGWLPPEGWRRLVATRSWSEWLTPARAMAGLAGLALGMGVLVSLGSLTYLLAVIPVTGLLVAGRRPVATPFSIGVLIGACYGLADGYLVSRPFLDTVSHTMELIGVIAVWLAALTIAVVQFVRVPRSRAWLRRTAGRRPARWLPSLAALLAVAALVGLAVRPYVQTMHATPSLPVYRYIAHLQRLQGLPVDPARSYAEETLYWVVWYIGLPTVLLAIFGIALLTRNCLRALLTWKDPAGAWRNWALPLTIICSVAGGVLWLPDIVPDQPWASRRLVVVVLPGLILAAIWAAVWLTGHARDRGARNVTAAVAGLFCVLALVVPTAATTFGAGLTHTGRSGGLRPSASGLAFKRTGAGEYTAVEQLCSSIRRNSSVVIVDRYLAQRFTQVIRGMCDVPAAWVVAPQPAAVGGVISGINAAGRHPVLLGGSASELAAYGGSPVKIMDLTTAQDPHDLTGPPTAPASARFVIWMLVPESGAVGI